ncbi:hypothetical protein EVAR_16164_1 [Eumeta japonica]|uniref:Uncharacterized protein n=1 Tax=Eumeta variegata TaxID=151549 RepID=A0A4C1WEE3_EUMVA|nr:hypothetical protein EVAR_16164_1 [Eumeta japonica]
MHTYTTFTTANHRRVTARSRFRRRADDRDRADGARAAAAAQMLLITRNNAGFQQRPALPSFGCARPFTAHGPWRDRLLGVLRLGVLSLSTPNRWRKRLIYSLIPTLASARGSARVDRMNCFIKYIDRLRQLIMSRFKPVPILIPFSIPAPLSILIFPHSDSGQDLDSKFGPTLDYDIDPVVDFEPSQFRLSILFFVVFVFRFRY